MVTRNSNPQDSSPSPEIAHLIRVIDRSASGVGTFYTLKEGLTREQRLAVLAALRAQHPGSRVDLVGLEVAVWHSKFGA